MKTIRTVAELRAHVAARRAAGERIGLVPTMGALHEGHLSLIRAAAEGCDEVVVSLFVNPRQFNDPADLDAYPRTEEADAELAAGAGADVLFAPPPEEVYPPGFSTTVAISGELTSTLEGAHRGAGHFHGVTTVVTKLLNMAAPDVAYFGAKDAQQVLVLRRLVADLDIPVRLEALPIVREADGLALSSRNVRLTAEDRKAALALPAALEAARAAVASGELAAQPILAAARKAIARPGVEPEYVELVNPATLVPITRLEDEALLVLAAGVGRVRLIDNTTLRPPGGPAQDPTTQSAATTP